MLAITKTKIEFDLFNNQKFVVEEDTQIVVSPAEDGDGYEGVYNGVHFHITQDEFGVVN